MNKARIRVVGTLGRSTRGLMLTTAQNEVWVIESDDAHDDVVGITVVAEGTISGFDRLRVDWLGKQDV